MSTKKCACFTPSGLVYTRLETDGITARRISNNSTRAKRSIGNEVYDFDTVESILKENPSIGHLRSNNEYDNEDEKLHLNDKIDKLIKETEAFIAAYEKTKPNIDHKRMKRKAEQWANNKIKLKNEAIINDNENELECKIEKDGAVNCSQVIYNDLKAWQTNRLSLEDQIRQLKTKLEDLKEIKQHLKITKPLNINTTEKQNIQTQFLNNQIHNKTAHISKFHMGLNHHRNSRVGPRTRPKNRNNTSLDKKISQSNDFVLPTVNTQSKPGLFDEQFKNYTTESTFLTPGSTDILNSSVIEQDLPKPQITTIIIDDNYNDDNFTDDLIINMAKELDSTETTKLFDTPSTRQITDEENSYIDQFNPVDFTNKVNQINTAVDKILSTEKSTIPTEMGTTRLTSDMTQETSTAASTSSTSKKPRTSNIGPTRLDASQYKKTNNNKLSNSVFGKPDDIFQRRLRPLYLLENEDQHVCYCEENRSLISLFIFELNKHTRIGNLCEQFWFPR